MNLVIKIKKSSLTDNGAGWKQMPSTLMILADLVTDEFEAT